MLLLKYSYCGEYFDTEVDSVYLRARYYRPTTGGFISEDPIQSRLNWYIYCDGNPISRVDPTGKSWEDIKNFVHSKIDNLSWCNDMLEQYGADINDIIGGTGFYYAESQNIFYSHINAWQRAWGYNNLYDSVADKFLNIYYVTFFFRYNQKDWRIECWKGDYGLTIGAEVGLYYKEQGSWSPQYDSVSNEDCLTMSMNLSTKDGEQLFYRTPTTTWWLTGFKVHSDIDPSNMIMKVRIHFKDSSMRNEFEYALNELNDDSLTFERVTDTEVIIWWK